MAHNMVLLTDLDGVSAISLDVHDEQLAPEDVVSLHRHRALEVQASRVSSTPGNDQINVLVGLITSSCSYNRNGKILCGYIK